MKVLWLCNMVPGLVRQAITGKKETGGLWVDQVLAGMLEKQITLHILCPGDGARGTVSESCTFATFREGLPYKYLPELEKRFSQELAEFQPEVIHIWGTEYGHTLAMVNACEGAGLLEHTAISIQGLCSVISRHYSEGIPEYVRNGWTFRDALRRDNICCQQKKFALRGELELKALKKVPHIIGRTDWDRACTAVIHPEANYHFCNETLREEFYTGQWRYDTCQKHRIFASSCAYPVKGFHYLLEAFGQVCRQCPEATLAVTGKSPWNVPFYRRGSYQKYLMELMKKYHLEDRVEFLGGLSAAQMKEQYLKANAFVLPSTIENSPNSLGEAMLLGVPCVAADVGGVSNLLEHRQEGFVYQSTAPYMLAHYVEQVFAMEGEAEQMAAAARIHAQTTHKAGENLSCLLNIYESIGRKAIL